jgi:hypothetical protein
MLEDMERKGRMEMTSMEEQRGEEAIKLDKVIALKFHVNKWEKPISAI